MLLSQHLGLGGASAGWELSAANKSRKTSIVCCIFNRANCLAGTESVLGNSTYSPCGEWEE